MSHGRAAGKRALLMIVSLTGILVFAALGLWQVERRAWKLALIEAVTERVHAAPVPAPSPALWPYVSAPHDQYRRVFAEGRLLNDRETLIQAITDRGSGYWVVTPLQTRSGTIILINRGYVSPERADRRSRAQALPSGFVRVVGLLRISEPHGRFLRTNQPSEDRWYSRDVRAIARARGLTFVAPFFIDADATLNAGGWPAGGLTVISFPNNHLAYALTWFGLSLLCGYAFLMVWRRKV